MIDLKEEYRKQKEYLAGLKDHEAKNLAKYHDKKMKLALVSNEIRHLEKKYDCVIGFEIVSNR